MRRKTTVKSAADTKLRRQKTTAQNDDPWELVWGQPYIDAARLAAAIENDLERIPAPDFRTRLLVRDATRALKAFWGTKRFGQWLAQSPAAGKIRDIANEKLGRTGFHAIRTRLVATIRRDTIEQVFRLLGARVHERVEVNVAGSIPTLIRGLTARPTDDIDFIDEVPAAIRNQRSTVQQIRTDFGLTLGHVQSHYLPSKWVERREYLGDFGGIRVYLIDSYDIFVSKLSSKQKKHQDDLRVLAQHLDKDTVRQRLITHGNAFLNDPFSRPTIDANWSFIFGEAVVPPASDSHTTEESDLALPSEAEKPTKRRRKRRQ